IYQLYALTQKQIFDPFSLSNHTPSCTVYQDFGCTGAGVVIRAHYEAIGTGAQQRDPFPGTEARQLSIECQKIACLADRAHDINLTNWASLRLQLGNLMVGLVVTGPDQIVHSRIHQDQFLPARVFPGKHGSEQHTGAADQVSSRLDDHGETGTLAERLNRLGEALGQERCFIAVANAESATDVEVLEGINAGGTNSTHQLDESLQAQPVRLGIKNLAADVHRNAVEPQPLVSVHLDGQVNHLVHRHAELDAALTRRDVRMGVGGNVGVHPDPDRHRLPLRGRYRTKLLQLVARFEVDVADACGYGFFELGHRLPHSAEHDAFSGESRGERPVHLPAGDDIRPGAQVTQHPQDGQVAVGLYREANPVRQFR